MRSAIGTGTTERPAGVETTLIGSEGTAGDEIYDRVAGRERIYLSKYKIFKVIRIEVIYISKSKNIAFVFIFMFWGVFTHLSIAEHYLWLDYTFNRIVMLSVFTAIGTTVFFYWWRSKCRSEEDNVPPKGMPSP